MSYLKAITDASTGETMIVPMTAEEVAELTERQAQAAAREVEAAPAVGLPTNEDIGSSKSIAELREYVQVQNAAINALLKRMGMA